MWAKRFLETCQPFERRLIHVLSERMTIGFDLSTATKMPGTLRLVLFQHGTSQLKLDLAPPK